MPIAAGSHDIHSASILFISPVRKDQAALRNILKGSHRTIAVASCRQACNRLSEGRIPIVLCDNDLPDGTWLDILHAIAASRNPPLLIVTSQLANDRLWAEVLNLGGFDVISKPFDATEVQYVIQSARRACNKERARVHGSGAR